MGVERSLRVTLIAHKEVHDKVLEELRDLAIFHFEDISSVEKITDEIRLLEEKISKLHFLYDVLTQFASARPLLSRLEDNRIVVQLNEFQAKAQQLDIDKLYQDVASLEEEIAHEKKIMEEIDEALVEVEPFSVLNISIDELIQNSASNYSLFLFLIPSEAETAIEKLETMSLVDIIALFTIQESMELTRQPFAVLCHSSTNKEVKKVLEDAGAQVFVPRNLIAVSGTLKEYYQKLKDEKAERSKKIEKLQLRLSSYTTYLKDVCMAIDFFESELEKINTKLLAKETDSTAVFSGWVLESNEKEMKQYVNERPYLHVDIEKPDEWNYSPVRLKNKKWAKPLETITRLYGLPAANETDPTPIFSVWFILFFGFCLGDAGYGLILMFLAYTANKFLNLKPFLRDFAYIFFWGGAASLLAGVLTGSYFSLNDSILPTPLLSLRVINPLEKPTVILVVSILVGILHLLLGMLIEIKDGMRDKGILVPLLEEGGKIIFIIGAVLWAVSFFSGPEVVPKSISDTANLLLVAGVILIVFFSAGLKKSFFRRTFSGLYNLYGMTSYLGDSISYARIMALGLATVLIGMAINIMAEMALGIPVIGVVIAVVIFIMGHIFNLLINIVSAFVHSMRLQFVEFFKQFYADGGRPFTPLSWKQKYIKLMD